MDVVAIRKVIDTSEIGFDVVSAFVKRICLLYLENYPVDRIHYYESDAIPKIVKAIERVIPRINFDNDSNTFYSFLQNEKLNGEDSIDNYKI